MDPKEKEDLLTNIAPYIENMEFFKELLENSKDIEDLRNKLNELIEKEVEITKRTDIKIILDKINNLTHSSID
ncbi:hypothetical protein KKP91_01460 [Methanothermococcus sp. SCGC AD-155-M21]|nr:hypothetical protein [Methanothermococcus sp. SCGC AD-155-M21]